MPSVLLDIEGTTTPISFVYETLFPFARSRMETYLAEHPDANDALRDEHSHDLIAPPWKNALDYAIYLMDSDRKSTTLKEIQGEIWKEGYASGDLRGVVYPDVPNAMARWHRNGIDVRIYSSGSVLAQKLLFSTTSAGDLTQHIQGYFDTTTGSKTQPESYTKIANAFGGDPAEIVFVSDVVVELDAAGAAGMKTLLCVRSDNKTQPSGSHKIISNFDEITLDRSSLRE
jgi:enolase-phosphatase E1